MVTDWPIETAGRMSGISGGKSSDLIRPLPPYELPGDY